MSRQHATPLLLQSDSTVAPLKLMPLAMLAGEGAIAEADIQRLVHEQPAILPIEEIDPTFSGAVSICRELRTPAGPIDNFLVTPNGLPVLVECKLWRNPEGRREVVGQILDYAKELSRWTQSDLQREANVRLRTTGNILLQKVREVAPEVDEIAFNDALSSNLRRGRFLLLIVGDGIREGVEAIAEYLQRHAGLHFSFGLVELPIFVLPDGSRLVTPRVLARTVNIVRQVVAVPEGMALAEAAPDEYGAEVIDPDQAELAARRQQFWKEFLAVLKLDDPEQPIPRPARQGYLSFMFPAPNGSSWLTVYRDMKKNEVGLFLSASRNSAGEYAAATIAQDWSSLQPQLGGAAALWKDSYGRPKIGELHAFSNLEDPGQRERAFAWLAERVNAFVNVLRPLVRSAVDDYRAREGA